jgi:hypothetical protein
MRRTLTVAAATFITFLAGAGVASAAPGWYANPGSAYADGIVTLDNTAVSATSYENQDLAVAVENGDVISFEYQGECGGGVPRVFIQGGAFNTFDGDPGGAACGTDTDGDGWYEVSVTVSGITDGTAGYTGIVNDNPSNPQVVLVRDLVIGGTAVNLAPAPTSKEQCKNGGYAAGGFANQGLCVSAFAG